MKRRNRKQPIHLTRIETPPPMGGFCWFARIIDLVKAVRQGNRNRDKEIS